jgi:hypothetical protein
MLSSTPDEKGAAAYMGTLFTSRIGYRGEDGLDITVKSATGVGRLLAPTWAMVGGVKHWKHDKALTSEAYTTLYYDLLRSRFRADRQPFLDLVQRGRLVLLCFCPAGTFCHRHLALDILEKIATANGVTVIRGGELEMVRK